MKRRRRPRLPSYVDPYDLAYLAVIVVLFLITGGVDGWLDSREAVTAAAALAVGI